MKAVNKDEIIEYVISERNGEYVLHSHVTKEVNFLGTVFTNTFKNWVASGTLEELLKIKENLM